MKKTLSLLSLAGLMVLSGCCCKKKADAGKCQQKTQQQKPCDKNKKDCKDKKNCDKKKQADKKQQQDKNKKYSKGLKPAHVQFDDVPALPLIG